ncbi:ZIP family metal transporter [Iodobacter ciconiae]|uniref:ZIP family metal transporter n=1 Tax=Iodobacter ciconiae TaxID=2496266 RepID=A0A3S8ZWY5_9NEIS|nr:ZIP family metal transporter [Iodobacter ciconiae]AZN37945.1 ZIP family metal transporter [Iodobacter ciconiae]
MSVLAWIMTASVAGSLLSVLTAACIAYAARPSWIPKLVSFAVGSLLAAAFLEILPHAFGEHDHRPAIVQTSASSTIDEHEHPGGNADIHKEHGHSADKNTSHDHKELSHSEKPSASSISLTLLAGILVFFIMEKLVIWRHCHHEECGELEPHEHSHGHGHGRAGLMIIVGDTFHNFLDGALIAAAFMTDINVGIATSLAIIAHEVPQEVGDFIVLLHSGYSKTKALLLNAMSSLAALIGALLAYWSLQTVTHWQPYLLALGASSMIYVAIADLIPGLHKRPQLKDTAQQVALILAGVAFIAVPHFLLPH